MSTSTGPFGLGLLRKYSPATIARTSTATKLTPIVLEIAALFLLNKIFDFPTAGFMLSGNSWTPA
jgi:hypothetical protein